MKNGNTWKHKLEQKYKRELRVSDDAETQWDNYTLLIVYQQKENLKLASELDLGPAIYFKNK